MGFNLFPLPLGIYTMIFEYYFPENTNIQLSCQVTTAYIHKQVQKDFTDYSKLLVQINNNSKTTPDYIYFTIHGTAVVSNPEGYIIVYGVKDWSDSVKSDVYDSDYYQTIFKYKNGDMQMQTNIDLNNHKIKNVPQAMDPTDLLTKQSIKIFDVSLYGTIDQHNYFTNHGVSIGFDSIYIVKITLINKDKYRGNMDRLTISHKIQDGSSSRLNYPFRFSPLSQLTVITINRLFIGEVIRITTQTAIQISFVLTYKGSKI